jgi:flagellar FliL protein
MAAAADPAAPPPAKKSKLPLLLGAVLAVVGGAGGFFAVQAGLLGGGGGEEAHAEPAADAHGHAPAVGFVPLPPLTVNIAGGDRFLRFAGQVEVDPAHLDEVAALTPRIVDVLNGYLRAVEPRDLESSAALLSIRSQLLRRVQVVAGADRVRDLLVMEFVVN